MDTLVYMYIINSGISCNRFQQDEIYAILHSIVLVWLPLDGSYTDTLETWFMDLKDVI